MKLPTLYKKSSQGKIEIWQISVVGTAITTVYGEHDGKMQTTTDFIKSGKNIGKVNETTPEEQAKLEAKSKWEKKLKSGYVDSFEKATRGETSELITGGVEPMLAHPFDKQGGKIKYPCFGQPKLDGIRCIAIKRGDDVTLWTRTRRPIKSCPHIEEAIKLQLLHIPEIILDGELYNHDLKSDFEKIVSAVRKDKPSEESKLIQYHVYDVVTNSDYIDRYQMIYGLPIKGFLREVETIVVDGADDIPNLTDGYIAKGYEGLMLRNVNGVYENKRSTNLIKVKKFESDEFTIIGIVEGRGKLSGHVGAFTCELPDGETFEAKLAGSQERLKELFDGPKSNWFGKQLTVKHQGKTSKGVPRFPVGVEIRDYE